MERKRGMIDEGGMGWGSEVWPLPSSPSFSPPYLDGRHRDRHVRRPAEGFMELADDRVRARVCFERGGGERECERRGRRRSEESMRGWVVGGARRVRDSTTKRTWLRRKGAGGRARVRVRREAHGADGGGRVHRARTVRVGRGEAAVKRSSLSTREERNEGGGATKEMITREGGVQASHTHTQSNTHRRCMS